MSRIFCNDSQFHHSNRRVMKLIKMRSAFYCNLKLLLIYLVVYGHLIEPYIRKSDMLMAQYQWIYLIHMPMFAFLSGVFTTSAANCRRQFLRMLAMYIVLQALAVWLGCGKVQADTPYWHLWYLLSCSFWYCIAWLWFRFGKRRGGILILILAITAGCLAGYCKPIGRVMSASRTIVFFPYFWLGVLIDRNFSWKRLRGLGLVALIAAFWLMHQTGSKLNAVFLYQAAPYGAATDGATLRLLCYTLAALIGLFLLSVIPDRRFFFTRYGADTMAIYLLHAPIVLLLRRLPLPPESFPLVGFMIICCVNRFCRWHSSMYGILQKERRDLQWPLSKKYTKNMQEKYINSC